MEDIMSIKHKPKGKGSKSKVTSKGKRIAKATPAPEVVPEDVESKRIVDAAPVIETTTTEETPKSKRNMTIEELQAEYLRVTGRETDSTDRRYILWKLNEAAKGKIRIGPVEKRPARNKDDIQAIPISLLRETTRLLDAAIKVTGIKSRSAFIRSAMIEKLRMVGGTEAEAAADAMTSEGC
jgi:hypothetical protein